MLSRLETARATGIPVAVVSNALSGAVHREYAERTGLGKQLAVQVNSDEAGIRKPNPELILIAACPRRSAWWASTTSTPTC